MPKEPSTRCSLSSKSRGLYKPYSNANASSGASQDSSSRENEDLALQKEWEDATCPICMEHPHNAVLLVCSSHGNGCRPYMCDTSYRHSNCFDQYRKANSMADRSAGETASVSDLSIEGATGPAWHADIPSQFSNERGDQRRSQERSSRRASSLTETRSVAGVEDRVTDRSGQVRMPLLLAPQRLLLVDDGEVYRERREDVDASRELRGPFDSLQRAVVGIAGDKELKCPLCRGKVEGWKVMESARQHLNHKKRSCSQESCSFSGTYDELRKHARGVHPLARPSDVDPARQRDWRRLERQRDLADVLSTFRSAMPGATFHGDFVIDEEEEGEHAEDGQEIEFPGDGENWWTMILLFQVFGPAASMGTGRSIGRLRGGFSRHHGLHHHHQSGNTFSRQMLWGENLQAPGGGGGGGGGGGANTLPSGSGGAGDAILGSTSRRRRSRPRSRGDTQ
eukprot:TRINITY_DN538_c0_g1_i1.p1 TRINITY_DN538_c0_g1~~TRINITY_DN538_c0_g1_i1.p1  ORF type:complete len:452 (+),score=32.21 TRINITY_DN538_c0_g1_i1:725-2080(+)